MSERIAKGQRRLFSVTPAGGGTKQVTRGTYDMSPDLTRGEVHRLQGAAAG